jgi:hypothetical protein
MIENHCKTASIFIEFESQQRGYLCINNAQPIFTEVLGNFTKSFQVLASRGWLFLVTISGGPNRSRFQLFLLV